MYVVQALFFNTCCAKKLKLKDKTQAKNSRKKLKKKTQPYGGTPLKFEKLKRITQFLKKYFWGSPKNAIFINKILSKIKIFLIFVNTFGNSFQKLKKKLKQRVKFPKT